MFLFFPLTLPRFTVYGAWTPNPSSSNYDFKARYFGEDSFTVYYEDYQGHALLYVAVYGWRACQYTIVGSFEGAPMLLEGQPQSGQVAKEGLDFYTFDIPEGEENNEIWIVTTPIVGRARTYVGVDGPPVLDDPDTYHWQSNGQDSGEVISIKPNDPFFPTGDPKRFYIAIFGDEDCLYQIVAGSNNTQQILRDSIPVQAHADSGVFDYYTMPVANNDCTLSVTLTAITGDPDLYMSTEIIRPNLTAYDEKSNHFGGDTIVYDPAPAGLYHIGVYAFRNSTYTIVGHTQCDGQGHNTTFIRLVDGIPQQDTLVDPGAERVYKFDVQGHHTELSVSISRIYGNPDLYITNNQFRPGPTNAQWRSTHYGDDSITIYNSDENWCEGGCSYYIGVIAGSSTSYSIVAATSDAIITLQDGRVFREDLTAGTFEYFQFPVDFSEATEITVSVSPLGQGDPDLYMSTSITGPQRPTRDMDGHTWSGRQLYGDSITISETDPNYCQDCTYYIGVYAYTNVTFTVVATLETPVVLNDGVTLSSSVKRGAMKYFNIRTLTGHSDLTISLTFFGGNANLYVGTEMYPEYNDDMSYHWAKYWYSGAITLVIREDDDEACKTIDCQYHIGVYGVQDANFTITASTLGTIIPLVSGVPLRSHVETGAWEYFSFYVDEVGHDLTFEVTPIDGDPDLYVSRTNQYPNSTYPGGYDKKSTTYGGDNVDYENAEVGIYYVAVQAFRNSTFSLTALLTNGENGVVALSLGEPQSGTILEGKWRYYLLTLFTIETSDLLFTVSKIYGDPDLYITNTGELPTLDEHQWSSAMSGGEVIRIGDAPGANYIVGVYAYHTSSYSLTVNIEGGITQLMEGAPISGQVQQGEYIYYKLFVTSPDYDVSIIVTPLSGDPDLYASRYNNKPNSTDYEFSGATYLGDSITIRHDNPLEFCLCEYFISVYGWRNSSYTLTAKFTPTQSLQDGVPAAGNVARHQFNYYRIRMRPADHKTLTITATPSSGYASLYVSLLDEPNQSDYQWVSRGFFTTAQVVIRPEDPDNNFCFTEECIYYIGVYGDVNCTYTLVASAANSAVTLQTGIPVTSNVARHEFDYFKYFATTPGEDLTFVMTMVSGDSDLFIGLDFLPNKTHFTYSSQTFGSDAVAVEDAPIGTYFVGAYGFSNSTFTVTVFESNDNIPRPPALLVNGVPQTNVLNREHYSQYYFQLTEAGEEVVITVTRRVGDPDIYVTLDGSVPSKTNYDFSSATYGEDVLTLFNPVPGRINIAVYSYTTTEYTVRVTTRDTIATLLDGVAFQEFLPATEYRYFRIPVDRTDMDLTVTATALLGDPDLYMGAGDQYSRPNATHYQWRAVAYKDDAITIPKDELFLGNYYVGVYAFTNTTYTIMATFSSTVRLSDGVPQGGSVVREGMKYFTLDVNDDHADLQVTVTGRDGGRVWLYVSTFMEPVHNEPNTYHWYSMGGWSAGPTTLTIKEADPYSCRHCTYNIGVYGYTASNFTIQASTDQATTFLQDDSTTAGNVPSSEWRYFRMYVPSASNLTIALEPCTGNSNIYASQNTFRPDLNNYQWKSERDDAIDLIDIKDGTMTKLIMYIGIFGARDGDFLIQAHTADTKVGYPVPGGDGIINFSPLEKSVQLQFNGVNDDKSYTYYVYKSEMPENSVHVLYTECGLAASAEVVLQFPSASNGELNQLVNDLNVGTDYGFQVVVEDDEGRRSLYRQITRAQALDPANLGSGGLALKYVFGIGLPVGIILILGFLYLYRKNRMLKKVLNIEMEDVDHRVRKAADKPGQRSWNRLMDEEPEISQGEYNPPEL